MSPKIPEIRIKTRKPGKAKLSIAGALGKKRLGKPLSAKSRATLASLRAKNPKTKLGGLKKTSFFKKAAAPPKAALIKKLFTGNAIKPELFKRHTDILNLLPVGILRALNEDSVKLKFVPGQTYGDATKKTVELVPESPYITLHETGHRFFRAMLYNPALKNNPSLHARLDKFIKAVMKRIKITRILSHKLHMPDLFDTPAGRKYLKKQGLNDEVTLLSQKRINILGETMGYARYIEAKINSDPFFHGIIVEHRSAFGPLFINHDEFFGECFALYYTNRELFFRLDPELCGLFNELHEFWMDVDKK